MSRYFVTEENNDYQPVTWWGGRAIYATHLIVLGYVTTMLVTTALQFARVKWHTDWLPFESISVLRGEVWRVVTYGFVNPPSLGFAIEMLMIFWFGPEVEKSLGRKKFLGFFAGIYLAAPLLFTVIGRWQPAFFHGTTGSLAFFVAFATLFPNAEMLFQLLAKWVAGVLVAIYTLQALANHDYRALLTLWATTGFAFAFVRHHQGHFELPRLRWPRKKPALRVLPDLPAKKNPPAPAAATASPSASAATTATMADIDALLDKIAKSGLASLSAAERARLEEGRARLLKRGAARS
ncbi:MAG: hypothetical protein RLZZ15_3523 [Verrucomicrobiota bacterium]|jgi:membrane associated rhomboid family serine protease